MRNATPQDLVLVLGMIRWRAADGRRDDVYRLRQAVADTCREHPHLGPPPPWDPDEKVYRGHVVDWADQLLFAACDADVVAWIPASEATRRYIVESNALRMRAERGGVRRKRSTENPRQYLYAECDIAKLWDSRR